MLYEMGFVGKGIGALGAIALLLTSNSHVPVEEVQIGVHEIKTSQNISLEQKLDLSLENSPDILSQPLTPFLTLAEERNFSTGPNLYEGEVYFCGTSRDFLKSNYFELFEASGNFSTGYQVPSCTLVPQDKSWVILDVPYVNQRDYSEKVRRNGCGPSSLLMGLEGIGYDTKSAGLDIFELYNLLIQSRSFVPYFHLVMPSNF